MNLPLPIVTALLTIIGGALTFVLGNVFIKTLLEPVAELKREIGKIAYSLNFYANKRRSSSDVEVDETRRAFRAHACRLQELANLIIGYEFWRSCLGLPKYEDLFEASSELIGHSNFSSKPDGISYDNSKQIRLLLCIRTRDDIVSKRRDEKPI